MSSNTEQLFTVEELAAYLRVTPATVRAMARDGRLPAVHVGRVWRFNRTDIDAWMRQQHSQPISATNGSVNYGNY